MRKQTKIGMKVALYPHSYHRTTLRIAVDRLNAIEGTVLSEPNSAGYIECSWKKGDNEFSAWLPPNEILATWADYEEACGQKLIDERARRESYEREREELHRRAKVVEEKLKAKGIVVNEGRVGDYTYLPIGDLEKLLGIKTKAKKA